MISTNRFRDDLSRKLTETSIQAFKQVTGDVKTLIDTRDELAAAVTTCVSAINILLISYISDVLGKSSLEIHSKISESVVGMLMDKMN